MRKKYIIILTIAIFCFASGALLFNFHNKSQSQIKVENKKMNKKIIKKEKNKKDFQENNILNKNKICIDPGHQAKGNSKTEEIAPGSNQRKAKVADGATGVATRKTEYELTLEIGLKLKKSLKNKGYNVFMVRETNDVNISNKERALMTNKEGCSVYLRLHADSAVNNKTSGASVLTSSPKNPYTKNIQKSSEQLSKAILLEYTKATGFKNRGVLYRDDLTGPNWSTVTNTLIEMGFMSNPEEDKKMASSEFQNIMVTGIINGIERYLKEK